jgi:ADP-ribose pyrophosphatase
MSGQQPPLFQTFIQEHPGWETVRAELEYANPYVQVYLATIRTPSRPGGAAWTIVHRKASTVIAPMTADGRLLLIRQERIPIRAAIWEFPAGQIDSPTEQDDAAIRATALRELAEEAGYELGEGGELIPMGCFFSSPGFTDEHGYLFLARGVVPAPGGPRLDENEVIHECRAFTTEEVRRMIAGNEIRDANTLSAFARMYALGLL